MNFVIGTNPDEMIEVKFDASSIDTQRGLHAYMNSLLAWNTKIRPYRLRKLVYYWGYEEENYVYYLIVPPWVKLIIVCELLLF